MKFHSRYSFLHMKKMVERDQSNRIRRYHHLKDPIAVHRKISVTTKLSLFNDKQLSISMSLTQSTRFEKDFIYSVIHGRTTNKEIRFLLSS